MAKWTKANLRTQYNRIKKNGFLAMFKEAAEENKIPLAYICAVASRETNCNNMLGDGGHGIGIIQIDIRYHQIARDAKTEGWWDNDPEPLVKYGVKMLMNNVAAVTRKFKDKPWFSEWAAMKIAASGYNGGLVRAMNDAEDGNSDIHTTGKDYGKDVMARMVVFQEFIDAEQ